MTPTPDGGIGAIECFLRDGEPLPDGPTLARAGLGPLAYARLPVDDPRRATLRDTFRWATARHLAIKLSFLPLLRAWRDAGVEVLVFKGFYLAEFAYRHPALRHYNDVDVLIRPEAWDRAEAIAVALGWTIPWRRRSSLYRWSHEEAVLAHGVAEVEVHRFVIDCNGPNDALQRRFTDAAWSASQELPWEGSTIGVLAPTDSVLMGLVLARAWSAGDDWHLKPADYPDLQTAAEKFGVSLDALRQRAAELGCARTLEVVLRRCDPWRAELDLRAPSRRQRRRWYAAVAPERGHLGLERLVGKARRFPGTVADTIRQLPRLLRTAYALRGDAPPDAAPVEATDERPRSPRSPLEEKERIVRGVKWGAQLLALGRDPCRLRSRALFDALRATPYPVRLYEGRARAEDSGARRPPLHGWIEIDGVALRDLQEVRPCRVDDVVACYASEPRSIASSAKTT